MMKKTLLYTAVLLSLAIACKKEGYVARVTEIRLVSVDPRNGYPGDLVTILGRNFSAEPTENSVTIGGKESKVLESTKDRMLVILPDNEPGSYSITVTSPAGTVEGLKFHYLRIPDKEYLVSTIVGQQGVRKCIDGVGTAAATYMPTGINKAPDGSLWFTDRGGNKIRRIGADLNVTTLADAAVPGAAVWQGCFGTDGNYYFNDKANGTFKRYTPADGKVTTLATGLKDPMNVALGPDGCLYVPARSEAIIYRFDSSWNKTVYATVPQTEDNKEGPAYIGFDPAGNLIVSIHHGYKLISVAPDGSIKDILGTGAKSDERIDAEDGNPLATTVRSCQGFDFDSTGAMYVTDNTYQCVRKLVPDANGDYSKGKVETIIGGVKGYADGKGLNVKMYEPDGILVYDDSTLYICDSQNCLVRKVTIK